MRALILSVVWVAVVGCTSHETTVRPVQTRQANTSTIELKEDFSASEFKSAVVGKWKSVFTYKNKRNIRNADFTPDGNASLVIEQANKSQQYSGPYTFTFDREPGAGAVTFATITIKPTGSDPIVLSRVNFGLHNGVHTDQGLLLRIDREPHGALKREN
jgi:hypothetical protein